MEDDSDDYTRDGLLEASRIPWLHSPADKQLKLFIDRHDFEHWGQKQEQKQEQTKETTDDE